MEDLKSTMSEMMQSFGQRMEQFESRLPKSSAPTTITELSAEYTDFKNFVTGALRALQLQIEFVSKALDQLEIRGRRKILLLHGVAEHQNEDVARVAVGVLVDRLKLTGTVVSDISRCHRMGRAAAPDRPRPILFKLRDQSLRSKIWAVKTSLKGSGITMSEFLTKARHDTFMAARERFGVSKCWTMDGIVYVLGADGKRHRVSCLEDLSIIGNGATATASAASSQATFQKPAALAKEPRAKRGATTSKR